MQSDCFKHVSDNFLVETRIYDGGLVRQAMRCFNAHFTLAVAVVVTGRCIAAEAATPLVDIESVDSAIVIELRYGGPNNLGGRALYPPGSPALVRPEVASRLRAAQAFLRPLPLRTKDLGCIPA
jgi:D-alanyl-D-alanine dipeptidase